MNRLAWHTGRGIGLQARRQEGLSLLGMVLVLVVIGFFAVIGMKVMPSFVEYRAALSAVKKAHASATTVPEIQKAFDRSAAIDDITTISGKDLDITKVNDEIVVAFAYTKKIELFGPVSLTIDYAGSSKTL